MSLVSKEKRLNKIDGRLTEIDEHQTSDIKHRTSPVIQHPASGPQPHFIPKDLHPQITL